jgi:hypothetical protein
MAEHASRTRTEAQRRLRDRLSWSRLQFRLPAVFVLVAVAAVASCCLLSWRENSNALRVLARQGAFVTLGAEPTCHESPMPDEQNVLESLFGVERVHRCVDALQVPRRTRISFVGRPFPSRGVDTLRRLSRLEAISIDGFPTFDVTFGDHELMGVADISGLRSFNIQANRVVSDTGVDSLRAAEDLEYLLLADCPGLRGPGLTGLASLQRLRSLYLARLAVGDYLIAALQNKPNLENLTLVEFDVSLQTLETIASLPRLRCLSLVSSRFGPLAVSALSAAPGIQELDLRYTDLTDADLQVLTRMKKLELIRLEGTDVSDGAVSSFSAARPLCVVER